MLSGPWVPGSGVSGQALAVDPDGKLLFSGGHCDGSLRVTALPRGKLVSQLSRHLGMSSLGTHWGSYRWGWCSKPGQEEGCDHSVLLVPPLPTQT